MRYGRFVIALVAVLGVFWPSRAWSDYEAVATSPIGDLAIPGNVTAAGAFSTTIPLRFPNPGGDLDVPFAIRYRGGHQVGVAGVGWDVPLPSVHVSQNISGRKPYLPLPGSTDWPLSARRVFLELGDGPTLMVPSSTPGWYRAFAGVEYGDLEVSGSDFRYRDLRGRLFTFQRLPALADSDYWHLTRIEEPWSANRIDFLYSVFDVLPVPSESDRVVLKELVLEQILYSYDASFTCPKHRIGLKYSPPSAAPLQTSIVNGRGRARTRLLKSIQIWSNVEDTGCSNDLHNLHATYELSYSSDLDTGQPRLSSVDQVGAGILPETGGARRPIARYAYGSTLTLGLLGYAASDTITLPAGPTEIASGFASMFRDGPYTARVKGFEDYDGDHLPDFLYPSPDLFSDSNLVMHLARNQPGISPSFGWDLFVSGPNSMIGVTQQHVFQQHVAAGFLLFPATWTWKQVIDVNGDGRPDVIDATGGRDPSGNPSPDFWRVSLNMPPASPGGSLRWLHIDVDISRIRAEILRHHALRDESWNDKEYLPVARSQSVQTRFTFQCNQYMWDPTTNWYRRHVCQAPESRVEWGAVTEWQLIDVNGDGLPDLVFNSARARTFAEPHADCPEVPSESEGIPHGCEGVAPSLLGLDIPASNQLRVFYNTGFALAAGAGARDVAWSTMPLTLREDGSCGVERRRSQDVAESTIRRHHQHLECGFVDVNGDGIKDYLKEEDTRLRVTEGQLILPAPKRFVYINSGLPQTYIDGVVELDQGVGFAAVEQARRILLPGPVALFQSFSRRCERAPEDFEMREYSALIDLTGDGVPDYVFFGTVVPDDAIDLIAPIDEQEAAGRTWWIMVGTGAGFRKPSPILAAAGVPFELYRATEQCGSFRTRVTAALADLDGDGRPEILKATDGGIRTARVVGGTGGLNARDSGHMVRIDNGTGASKHIKYDSAKSDGSTLHQLPFPELVVSEVYIGAATLGLRFGSARYAYGDASQLYHPLLGRWIFTGYGRIVILTGLEDSNGIYGQARLIDAFRPSELREGYDRYVRAGRVREISYLSGRLPANPAELLVTTTTDPKVKGGLQMDLAIKAWPEASADPAPREECGDFRPFSSMPTGADARLCRRNGQLYSATRYGWQGEGPGDVDKMIRQKTSVESVDGYGRPTRIRHWGDLSRTDDDVCEDIAYSEPVRYRVLTAIRTRSVTNCGHFGFSTTFARVQYRYDGLPEPNVSRGLPTTVNVDRFNLGNGSYIGTSSQEYSYDAWGNRISTKLMKDGRPLKWRDTTFDRFGVQVRSVTTSGISVPNLTRSMAYHVAGRSWVLTNEHGNSYKMSYDVFNRPTRHSRNVGPREEVLREWQYQDDAFRPEGRQIVVRLYHDSRGSPADYIEKTIFIDDFGGTRFVEQPLGADYGNATLVAEYVEMDTLGRPKFVADQFVKGELAYGTSYTYYADDRLRCSIRGQGHQTGEVTDAESDIYPTCFSYTHMRRQFGIRAQGPSELRTGALEAGFSDNVFVSAIGRVLYRTREAPAGATVDYIDFSYDKLGNVNQVRRKMNPGVAGGPFVTWEYSFDSLGSLLQSREAGGPAVTRIVDDQGNVESATWTETSTTPNEIRGRHNTYDAYGRLSLHELTKRLVGSDITTVESSVMYAYDVPAPDGRHATPTNLLGRLSYVTAPNRLTYFGYDEDGRPASVTRVDRDDPLFLAYREHATYGLDGSSRELTFTLPDHQGRSDTLLYGSDSARRVRTISWSDGTSSEKLFDATSVSPLGAYQEIRLGNGAIEHFTYRPDRRREIRTWRVSDALGSRKLTTYSGFDGEGRVLGRTEDDGSTVIRYSFVYDTLRRLHRAQATTASDAVLFDETYSYDGLGNLTRIDRPPAATDQRFTAAPMDHDRICRGEVLTPTGVLPTSPGCTYAYDLFGNVKTILDPHGGSARTFSYDALSRLVRMQNGSATAAIDYDGLGDISRVQTSGVTNGARADVRYGPLVESSLYADGQRVLQRRIPGPLGVFVTLLGPGGRTGKLYGHYDGNAGRQFTDQTGTVVQRIDYTPFGIIANESGASEGSLQYSKYLWNGADTLRSFSVFQIGARFYDLHSSRFLQRDPLLVSRGSGSTHPYLFAQGDPANFADPSGSDAGGVQPSGDQAIAPPGSPGMSLDNRMVGIYLGWGGYTIRYRVDNQLYETSYSPDQIATDPAAEFEYKLLPGGILAPTVITPVNSIRIYRAIPHVNAAYNREVGPLIERGVVIGALAGIYSSVYGGISGFISAIAQAPNVGTGLVAAGRRAAGSPGYDMALGLARHEGTGQSHPFLLRNFARHVGGKTYGDIYGSWWPGSVERLQLNIETAMKSARRLHFNLDQLSMQTFREFTKNPVLRSDNITNWEMYRILSSPSLLGKTTFYGPGGNVVAAPDLP